MKVELINGKLFINSDEVMVVCFKNGTTQTFPIDSTETLVLDDSCGNSTAGVLGNHNTTVVGKNIINGSVVSCGGDFRLGDG